MSPNLRQLAQHIVQASAELRDSDVEIPPTQRRFSSSDERSVADEVENVIEISSSTSPNNPVIILESDDEVPEMPSPIQRQSPRLHVRAVASDIENYPASSPIRLQGPFVERRQLTQRIVRGAAEESVVIILSSPSPEQRQASPEQRQASQSNNGDAAETANVSPPLIVQGRGPSQIAAAVVPEPQNAIGLLGNTCRKKRRGAGKTSRKYKII